MQIKDYLISHLTK